MNIVAKKGKFPLVGDVVALLLLFLVVQFVVVLVLQQFGVAVPAMSDIDTVSAETYLKERETLARYYAILYPLTMIIPLLVMWCYVRLRGGRGVARVRCSVAGFNPSVILVGVVWLLAAQILLEPLTQILPQPSMPEVGLGLWAYVTTILFAPILEELLCRGLLFETFNKRWGVKLSIFLSALFFGLIHFDISTAIVATIAGMIFGVLYVRTSSIFASIIVHAINNAMAFTLIVLEKENISFREILGSDMVYYIVYGVAALIFIAASVEAYFKLKAKQAEPKVADSESNAEISEPEVKFEDTAVEESKE